MKGDKLFNKIIEFLNISPEILSKIDINEYYKNYNRDNVFIFYGKDELANKDIINNCIMENVINESETINLIRDYNGRLFETIIDNEANKVEVSIINEGYINNDRSNLQLLKFSTIIEESYDVENCNYKATISLYNLIGNTREDTKLMSERYSYFSVGDGQEMLLLDMEEAMLIANDIEAEGTDLFYMGLEDYSEKINKIINDNLDNGIEDNLE